ncbi:MAG: hypothetical protein ABH833_01955 [Parcubacteria group bacterium]
MEFEMTINKKITLEDLAGMVARGFTSVEKRMDTMATKEDLSELRTEINGELRVTNLNMKILQTDVRVLKTDVRVLKTDVATLKSDVKKLATEESVEKIDRRVRNLEGDTPFKA